MRAQCTAQHLQNKALHCTPVLQLPSSARLIPEGGTAHACCRVKGVLRALSAAPQLWSRSKTIADFVACCALVDMGPEWDLSEGPAAAQPPAAAAQQPDAAAA